MSQSSGIHLCHRRLRSSTTSDIHHSTSATAETVATSAEFVASTNSHRNSVDDAMQRCGFCTLLSRLLRRAMCVGSRRGSAESYYQELAETANPFQPSESSTMKSSTHGGGVYVCLIPPNDQENQRKNQIISEKVSNLMEHDIQLIEALVDEKKQENARRNRLSNGRFLTMHKRRRKKLTTRSLIQDPAILDDVLHGQVQCILNQAGNWRFNAFTLETVTGGRSLPVLCVHLFHWYGLLDHFNLDVVRLWKLFTLIEEGYHSTNPYHNSIHATDVTQAMHCFLQETKILENLQPVEILASLLGAVTHDLDHPGVNQPFLIATSNHLAALYENISVLENHHWRSAVGCLLESGVAEQINDIRPIVEKQIASLILATDITRQTEFLTKFRNLLDTNTLDMKLPVNRHFILQISLKCADISNPCRPWDIGKKWSQKVCEEFFRQGDYERQLNLPVTSLCDRFSNSVPKIQVGFFKYVVTPLFDEWHKFLNTNLSTKMMKYLKENEIQWEKRVAAEIAEETKTEISDAEMLEEDEQFCENDEDEDEVEYDKSNSSEVLLPEIKLGRRSSLQVPKFVVKTSPRFDRRFSVPVNPPKIVLQTEVVTGQQNKSRNSIIQENIQEYKFEDSFSILSSGSENEYRNKSSLENSCEHERPLSAENLVPELNIATMSNSECADRLNIVLHRSTNFFNVSTTATDSATKQLIRQQTFPPLQPYIRTRYLSATAEMSGPTSTSTELFTELAESSQIETYFDESQVSTSSSKQDLFQITEKSHKIARLSIPCQKENMDPTKNLLGRRRGSAPVDSSKQVKHFAEGPQFSLDSSIRRGSVPAYTVQMPITEGKVDKPVLATTTAAFQRRRGSVPFDSISATIWESTKIKNRKKFKRRSSGGPEILTPILGESESSSGPLWRRHKRTDHQKSDVESILNRRRGSLPIEVLSVNHTAASLRH